MTATEAKIHLASYVAYGSFDTMTETQREAIEMAGRALDQMERMNWIPLKERTPEPGRRVLRYWPNPPRGESIKISFFTGTETFGGREQCTTYWMDLPDPPQEGPETKL